MCRKNASSLRPVIIFKTFIFLPDTLTQCETNDPYMCTLIIEPSLSFIVRCRLVAYSYIYANSRIWNGVQVIKCRVNGVNKEATIYYLSFVSFKFKWLVLK